MDRTNHRDSEMNSGARTMRYGALSGLTIALILATAGLPGCAEPGGLIDRTQTNLVDKSIFAGEWWYMRTVAALEDDAAFGIASAGAGAPWPGAMSNYDIASRSGVVGRIRWVVDENFLYAYRSHEIVIGAADNPDDPTYRGQPMAIFPISGHVDVRREYDSVTGEPRNVLAESQDRRWYDRQYVRVDWSTNLVTWGLFGESLQLDGLFGAFRREPVANFVQEGGDPRIPASWRPTFVRIGDDPTYRFRDEWPAGTEETVHYMSFVTNELWTPMTCFGPSCETSIRLSVRHAFLRIPPEHEYAVETLPNSEYDRFGIIRTEQRTYIRGGQDRSERGVHCDARCVASCTPVTSCRSDFDCGEGGTCSNSQCVSGRNPAPEECGTGGMCENRFHSGWGQTFGSCVAGTREDADDCGVGTMCDYGTGACGANLDADCGPGLCNTDTNICEGGLTGEYGETDFLTYYRLRHNFHRDSYVRDASGNTVSCVADWECDRRFEADTGRSGSRCDTAAGVCTLPMADRPIRPVSYRLSPHFPRHLVRSAFELVSQWNETFMKGNRELHGTALPTPTQPRIPSQDRDPTQYCYQGATATAGEVAADGTCAYRENFFVRPDARPSMNPYDCWIGLVDAAGNAAPETDAVDPAAPESLDEYTDAVYSYAFVGTECMLLLHTNSCDRPVAADQPRAACEELGDIRHQFLNYVSAAGAGWCGVMQQVSDPMTGEAISVPINQGGLCLERIANTATELWPILRGEVDETVLYSGENLRGYFENLGNVHVPVGLAPAIDGAEYAPDDPSRPAMPRDAQQFNAQINAQLERVSPRIQNLRAGFEGRAAIHSDRMRNVQGTTLERRLVEAMTQNGEGINLLQSNDLMEATVLNNTGTSQPSTEQMMEQLSPFRGGFRDLMMEDRLREMALSNSYIHYPREALFTSRYNQWWAEAFRGRSLKEAHIRWTQAFFRAVMLHEMGHGLGLEHNFAASYDRDHYQDGYFGLVTRTEGGRHTLALPEFFDFDCGTDNLCPGDTGYTAPDALENDGEITSAELTHWAQELRRVRTERAEAGIGNYMTSSLMDYNGDLSDMAGLGHYDRAAVYFNYFNLVETFEGDPTYRAGAGTSLDGLLRSDITPRRLWTHYRGGESCDVDNDCPFASGSSALVPGQQTFQRCIRNPRYSGIPTACNGDRNCICSGFDDDLQDLAENAYPGYGFEEFNRVNYMFCSNPRLGDISWCNTFDAGESFQETIDHYRQLWQENYPRSYFRNYRRGFASGSRATQYIVDAAKIYQHLFFSYYYEPEFRREAGPLGLNDQWFASADAMNWLAELAQLPDVGSYRRVLIEGPADGQPACPTIPNPARTDCYYGYEQVGSELNMPGSDIDIAPGQGYYNWSRYQDGLYGFFRMERAGVFWDKYIALLALTTRDWGLSFTIDERYYINFYDLWPVEMTEIFGGFVIDDSRWMAPRVSPTTVGREAQVEYINFMLGGCGDDRVPCDRPVQDRFPAPPILGTSNDILRTFAAVFALAEFPIYYDPSFESRLAIFKVDNADGFTIPNVQTDGAQTEFWGSQIPGTECADVADTECHRLADGVQDGDAVAGPEDADYIVYNSDRLHTPYVAVKVRQRIEYNLEEEQLGFQLLLRLYNQQERVRALAAIPAPTPAQREELSAARRQLQQGESFLETLIEIQRIFGITSWF